MMKEFKDPIWEGIYKDFSEALKQGKGFEGSTWLIRSLEQAQLDVQNYKEYGTIPPIHRRHCSLAMLIASAYSSESGLRILDFGGGMGLMYLMAFHETSRALDYLVIENSEICQAARKLFEYDPQIRFRSQIPVNCELDILYVNSVLQYIDEWEALITELCELSPEYILFDDLYAGDIPNFISVQKYYESLIPHRFYNVGDFIQEVEKNNYQLQLKHKHTSPILGKSTALPLANFPNEFQLDYACTLLFKRNPPK